MTAGTASAFSTASSRPLVRSSRIRAGRPLALAPDAVTDLLAGIIPGIEGYGGVSAFSQNAAPSAGSDMSQVFALAIGFPLVLCAVVYKDNIASIFEPPPEVEPPRGWQKVESRSRPGKFSYENMKTGERYDRIPNSAWNE